VHRYSFGTGAQMLPIPELMPFRLTRQMRGALQPHVACELLKAPVALGLTALRAGSSILEVGRFVLSMPLSSDASWGIIPVFTSHLHPLVVNQRHPLQAAADIKSLRSRARNMRRGGTGDLGSVPERAPGGVAARGAHSQGQRAIPRRRAAPR
jgi:hypothetical protein